MDKPAETAQPLIDTLQARWSPYAFDSIPVSQVDLLTMFEAARWAPSSFNEQPWRFILGSREYDPATHAKLVETLFPGNAVWAKDAPVLALGIAKKTFSHNGSDNRVSAYDTGQAVGALTAQAGALNLFLHQMGGFDIDKARALFAIPDDFAPMAMIALGYMGESSNLPTPELRAKHDNPERVRKPIDEIVFGGAFGTPSPTLR